MQRVTADTTLTQRRGPGCAASLLVAGIAFFAAFPLGSQSGLAQQATGIAGSGASYVTPFPAGDIYKLQVYGDIFADGLLDGLAQVIGTGAQVDVAKKARAYKTLTRSEYEDDIKTEEQSRDVLNVGVITMGYGDRNSLKVSGSKTAEFGTEAWKDQYGRRLDRLFKALKRRNIALYVVSLPPVRRQESNAAVDTINGILLEKSSANGIRFIEVAESFTDEGGAFTQFGLDTSGTRAKLRDADGVEFTQAGYRKMAVLVANEIKRDLTAAREERSVPLAGGESEQRRINPDKVGLAPVVPAARATPAKDGRAPLAAQAPVITAGVAAPAKPAVDTGAGGQKVETSRIVLRFPSLTGRDEISMTTEIVRPAVPAAVIALLSRKETVEAGQQPFDLLIDDVGDGVSVTTMVTAINDGTAGNGRRRGPNAFAAYTAVWVKGERLPSKPGRADDFAWPRPDPFAVTAMPATAPAADKKDAAAAKQPLTQPAATQRKR